MKPVGTMFVSRLANAPRDLITLTGTAIGFCAFGLGFAYAIGAPIVFPSGNSPALGTDALVPFVITIGVYLALQVVTFAAATSTGGDVSRCVLLDLFLAALFFVVVYVHFHLKMWVPLVNDRSFDAAFLAVDEHLRVLIEGLRDLRAGLAAILPALDGWYHSVYFSLFALSFWFHSIGTRTWHVHNMVALTLVEAIGPLFYLVAPAVGPFAFEPGDNAHATEVQHRMFELYSAMRDGGVSWIEANGSQYFTAPLAAMPSLHLAGALVIAYYAVRGRLVVAPVLVAAAGWIAIEAVVTRWHYVVDLPAGAGVAVVAIVLANRLCAFRLNEEARASVAERAPAVGRILPDAKRPSL